jgi:hypothetical protein
MIPSLQSVAQGDSMRTVRLTAGQAIVRFLAAQETRNEGAQVHVAMAIARHPEARARQRLEPH